MITVDSVTKTFKNKTVIDNISFNAKEGCVFGLLGPNGAGKTTLIRMLLNIIQPDSGIITYDNTDLNLKNRIGYLPEERGLYKNQRIIDILTYLGMLKGLNENKAKEKSNEYLEKFDLSEYKKNKTRTLSKGMQQKVQIIATLLFNPEIIILDEPFSGLDPVNVKLIKDIILEEKEKNKVIILSSHQMNMIEELCDDILIINKGKQVIKGDINEIRKAFSINEYIINSTADYSKITVIDKILYTKENMDHILLKENAESNDLLREIIAQNAHLQHFEKKLIPLSDLYIKLVNEHDK